MNIVTLLTGSRFKLLTQEGKQVDRLIKNSMKRIKPITALVSIRNYRAFRKGYKKDEFI